jgi:hypothetical protein
MSEYIIEIGEVTLSQSDMKQFYSIFNLDCPKELSLNSGKEIKK